MNFSNKVVVITGASSGIGRLTALQFAKKGARLGLIARSSDGLSSLASEIRRLGGRSFVAPMDVTDSEGLKRAASHIADEFGKIDIWINNAASSVYAEAREMLVGDLRRVMDVNFYGQVYGVQAALPYLDKSRGQLIAILSVESEIGVPFHSAYSASKHALYGYYKSLYAELLHDRQSKVRVSTILPSSISTPFFEHSKTLIGVLPKPVPPIYHPQLVVDTIFDVAERPRFSTVVGQSGKRAIALQRRFPELLARLQSRFSFSAQKSGEAKSPNDPNNLYYPVPGTSKILGVERPTLWAGYGKWILRGALALGFLAYFRREEKATEEVLTIPTPMSGLAPAATGDETVTEETGARIAGR